MIIKHTMDIANNWVISYLEALLENALDTTYTSHFFIDDDTKITTRFYLQQLVSLEDDSLYNGWKNMTYRCSASKDTRDEYIAWRVWSLKHNNNSKLSEHASTINEEEDVLDAEVCSEIAKLFPHIQEYTEDDPDDDVLSNISADLSSIDTDDERFPKLYCILISLHGLVRGENMELGKDADTGGQVKYVVEFAKALGEHPAVHRVDLLTRYIEDPEVDVTYAVEEEPLMPHKCQFGGAYINRIKCGPSDKYLRKEELWPFVREFSDNAVKHIKKTLSEMFNTGEICELYVVHGHYADAGESAILIGDALGVDVVFTGHSLGRNKLDHLLKSGKQKLDIERQFSISRRIEAEECVLDNAALVFTSTRQEIYQQWGMYHGVNLEIKNIPKERHYPKMVIIPPGINFDHIKTYPYEKEPDIWTDIFRFLTNNRKPVILAMSRPDTKKNIERLLQAFGESSVLRNLANLVLILGNRESIEDMSASTKNVMKNVLQMIDKYNLYGSVAYPKSHTQTDISDIYALPFHTKGVFVNIALHEPFGFTLIEAASHGVPVVATQNGGPVEILQKLENGILVDPYNIDEIANAIIKLVTDNETWEGCSLNGIRNVNAFSWNAHCQKYLEAIDDFKRNSVQKHNRVRLNSSMDDMYLMVNKQIGLTKRHFSTMDIERVIKDFKKNKNAMVNPFKTYKIFCLDSSEYVECLLSHMSVSDNIGLVSVFDLPKTLGIIKKNNLTRIFDFVICICGAEIWYYDYNQGKYVFDKQYNKYIDDFWYKDVTSKILIRFLKNKSLPNLKVYTEVSHHRILISISHGTYLSYFVESMKTRFRRAGVRVRIVVNHTSKGHDINIIPIKASRSLALRYVLQKHNINLNDIQSVCIGNVMDNKANFLSSDTWELIEGTQKNIVKCVKGINDGFAYDKIDLLIGNNTVVLDHDDSAAATSSSSI
jgi:sucrose-phosphate synthase